MLQRKCAIKRRKDTTSSAMQTLRKKTSPLKYKNETSRFLGEGVSFKAKLIGILEVSEARGDRMCQDALSDLKMAIRAAGEHKQRITINIAIDGLRLRDEKTGDSLYHHPVHKISFIAQDMTDSRAFGYIFGSPDTGHRFFGIKTDKAASQVVIAMRDLFQVVFALKKKEIEMAKQHLDKNRYGTSSLFSDSIIGTSKTTAESTKTTDTESKTTTASSESRSTPAVADLVDLELELNSLQQGLTQMERITPSDPFGSKDDPFGDSFIMYPQQKKLILPPPPSGRERSSRTISETSSVFSPKTPHTGDTASAGDSSLFTMNADFSSFSQDFNTSNDEPSSGDWFTPPPGNSIFEEPSTLVPEPPKDQHEITKQEILSQFDVFTELDPLGTGKSKPYVDKKHFFQELKNPPKKVLNDLVSESLQPQEPSLFSANFETPKLNNLNSSSSGNGAIFTADPFGEDPFDKTDPFADFKQDPFESEFDKPPEVEKYKFTMPSKIEPIYTSVLSKSPKSSVLEKQTSLAIGAPRNFQFNKQNTFDVTFDDVNFNKMSQMHENPSLDMSSETESAPEPPPRPLTAIKPPPLPPKKAGEGKPPPRPPHQMEDSHYDYMDNYESGSNSMEIIRNLEKSPPLPVPSRKAKFESDFTSVPERPKKQFNVEDDYLTPISFPASKSNGKESTVQKHSGPVLLPPPQRSARKTAQALNEQNKMSTQPSVAVTVASFLESKPNITTSIAADKLNYSLEGLDITLSQLTLSGLNELATKLNIPPSQLSNMTLVQLTNYLSNFIKNSTSVNNNPETSNIKEEGTTETEPFQADFAANFNNTGQSNLSNTNSSEPYDRYAVFRELLQEEIKQTKIDTEPVEISEEKEKEFEQKIQNNVVVKHINEITNISTNSTSSVVSNNAMSHSNSNNTITNTNNVEMKTSDSINNISPDNLVIHTVISKVVPTVGVPSTNSAIDRYAALREIVENEIKLTEKEDMEDEDAKDEEETNEQTNLESTENLINSEKTFISDETKDIIIPKKDVIEYNIEKSAKSPVKSPITVNEPVTDVQNNSRLNSGSLSDVISGSSPEVDNTGSNSEVAKKTDATGESWAIFDQPNLLQESNKEKQAVQSEEGVSPWSSDSKEFGNGSPTEWRHRGDSGSGGEHWNRRSGRREQDGWWDTSAEPEVQYYPANRRSTDSYDDEYYECYDRPRRRRNWSGHGGGSAQAAGGHSSSSRDVSPWEEEPRRREHRDHREGRQTWSSRHGRQHSFDRHRDRRHTDSWDEDDDYEYEDDHPSRFHWPDRHGSRDSDRERHSAGSRDMDSDRWAEDWSEDRRHRRRRESDRDRWCCPDWEQGEGEKPPSRYSSGRWSNPDSTTGKRRERKHDDRYYSRDSQESPWEDEYSNEPEDSHYLSAKKNWKRPSSASEMDRKKVEMKSRPGGGPYYLATGGSDGERDRRYKSARRSKSRDSQYTESSHRHKPDPGLTLRGPHRTKGHQKFENDFVQETGKKVEMMKADLSNKKPSTLNRKKPKESPKEEIVVSTFPRKGTARAQSLFENDFVPSENESPLPNRVNTRFTFENDFETSEAESPTVQKPTKTNRPVPSSRFDADPRRQSNFRESKPRFPPQTQSKSMFEDDFSPTEKAEVEESNISSIKEEGAVHEEEDSFNPNNFDRAANRKKILAKNRLSGGRPELNLKKSDSVNIFGRENDPFDDDFFSSGQDCGVLPSRDKPSLRGELKWTEEFRDFDINERK